MERQRVEIDPIGEVSILKSPKDWVEKTDLIDYAMRQAQSCEYLRELFPNIKQRAANFPDIDLSRLLDPLLLVHERQFDQLVTALFGNYQPEKRDSFYFNEMYRLSGLEHPMSQDPLDRDGIAKLVAVHGFSYLRGADRYDLLKEYDQPRNALYIDVWKDFFQDASGNWARTWEFMKENFDTASLFQIVRNTAQYEEMTMIQIWKHDRVEIT